MTEHDTASPNSALVWLPALIDTANESENINTPDTEIIQIERDAAWKFVDGDGSELPIQEIRKQAERIGYPVFVRTDISSAKHKGVAGIRARNENELHTALGHAIESTAMAMGTPAVKAIIIRKWLTLDWRIEDQSTILTDSHKRIAREFRVFGDSEKIYCTHFYWPQESIENPVEDDWKVKHQTMQTLSDTTKEQLEGFAKTVASETPVDKPWSVDFASDNDGEWWAIDMALAEDSWHPDCEHTFPKL